IRVAANHWRPPVKTWGSQRYSEVMPDALPSSRAAFWDTLVRFETAKITPWLALRHAIGVALPLAVGAATGQAGGGLIMTLGALNVAFSDGSDPYVYRGRRM